MTNSLILVGRVVRVPELKDTDNNTKVATLTIAIPRAFKNIEGNYDTDFVDCTLWNVVAQSACEYCKKGDVVAIKGRIQSYTLDKEEMPKLNMLQVIAERISFIANSKKIEEEKDKKVST